MNRVFVLFLIWFLSAPAFAQMPCPADGSVFLKKHGIDLSDFDQRCSEIRDNCNQKLDELGGDELIKSCNNIKATAPDVKTLRQRLEKRGCNEYDRLQTVCVQLNDAIGKRHLATFKSASAVAPEAPLTLEELESYTESFKCGQLWLTREEQITNMHYQYMKGLHREVLHDRKPNELRSLARNAKSKAEQEAFCRKYFARPDGL